MTTRLFRPANDNNINPAWLRFKEEEPELFAEMSADARFMGLLRRCKQCFCGTIEASERSSANFIWFMKFERSFAEASKQVELRVVT